MSADGGKGRHTISVLFTVYCLQRCRIHFTINEMNQIGRSTEL